MDSKKKDISHLKKAPLTFHEQGLCHIILDTLIGSNSRILRFVCE